jgi:hypothetical protein
VRVCVHVHVTDSLCVYATVKCVCKCVLEHPSDIGYADCQRCAPLCVCLSAYTFACMCGLVSLE